MKKLTKREFDSKFQNLKDWPLETSYSLYLEIMESIEGELRSINGKLGAIAKGLKK